MSTFRILAIVGALALVGCGKKKDQPQSDMPGMQEMPGMAMRSDSFMPMMRADLDSLARMPLQFAKGMLQAHEAIASQMLDAMGSDMTMMNMRPDSSWTALVDSVKRDLAELPSLSGRALETRVQAHVRRCDGCWTCITR
jgi:predicted outer membrane protein